MVFNAHLPPLRSGLGFCFGMLSLRGQTDLSHASFMCIQQVLTSVLVDLNTHFPVSSADGHLEW